MQSIHFSVRPYRNYKNEISNEFIYLCLVKDNGDVVERQSIRTSAWRNNENGCREYWKHNLLTHVKDVLINASKAFSGDYIYNSANRPFDQRWSSLRSHITYFRHSSGLLVDQRPFLWTLRSPHTPNHLPSQLATLGTRSYFARHADCPGLIIYPYAYGYQGFRRHPSPSASPA